MDFFRAQETLTAAQWVLRAVVAYLFMLVMVKVMGQRSISQLNLLDLTIAVIIGNIIAHPLSDEGLGLKGSMISIVALVVLYLSSVFLVLKSGALRRLVTPQPLPLVENGQLIYENFRKARITIEYMMAEARRAKVEDLKKLSLALWEPDGTISFFVNTPYQPVTPDDLKMEVPPFDLPRVVVREGKAESVVLAELGKDEEWLLAVLEKEHYVRVQDVLLATLGRGGELKLFLYDYR